MPIQAANWSDMVKLARQVDAPVILYDRDLPGVEWQKGIPRLVSASNTPCLILLSDVSDPYLWDELVQHGGFDLLTRPFQREKSAGDAGFCLYPLEDSLAQPAQRPIRGSGLIYAFRNK